MGEKLNEYKKINTGKQFIADVKENRKDQLFANIRRTTLCVNACLGITDEALEAGIIKESMEFFCKVSDKTLLNEKIQMTYKGKVVFEKEKQESE
jgi:hypothetical protein